MSSKPELKITYRFKAGGNWQNAMDFLKQHYIKNQEKIEQEIKRSQNSKSSSGLDEKQKK